ncbi:2-hydroxychromene-2-carboxylate isomerase [Sneathiella sp.]|uniref:2-hydroxychromene-2-carboxylate isomerase n=1 Tax=Sneathiella sp. TaxID=1964365 RepID=UPI00260A0400|nr:2-hydroxychromene-2-carboxylate isomerase [Sneathiella sp.]MDF2368840.1 2-hydroxychromene-2-carboxylate isomerase [Sneathiella sp.]
MSRIEYYYAGYSAYAYLGHAELLKIAHAAGREIDHRPFDLRKLIEATGTTAFGNRSQAHKDYFFGREIVRWAEYRGIPVLDHTPTYHHHDITLSNCMLIAGLVQGLNIDRLSDEMLRAHWAEDFDLDNPDDLRKIGERAGINPDPLLNAAASEEVRKIYAQNTEEAIRLSLFGSPTYFVDGDMFYGQDHLEVMAHTLGA